MIGLDTEAALSVWIQACTPAGCCGPWPDDERLCMSRVRVATCGLGAFVAVHWPFFCMHRVPSRFVLHTTMKQATPTKNACCNNKQHISCSSGNKGSRCLPVDGLLRTVSTLRVG